MNLDNPSSADQEQEGMSTFAAAFAGTPPSLRRAPPPGAVRRHALDDAQRRAPGIPVKPIAGATSGTSAKGAHNFTPADKAMIRRVHGYMNTLQLLGILNERLTCDVGHTDNPFTIEQLHAEIASVSSAVPSNQNDWASLRKLLAKARRAGVLDLITEQTINDFAVVYSLNQKQVLTLKDTVLQAAEEDES
jgi:hypothetical protein